MLTRWLVVSAAVVAVAGCPRPAQRAPSAESPVAAGARRDTAAAQRSPSVVWRQSVPLALVFQDTVAYRRLCKVPPGRPVDLKQPCELIDQSQSIRRLDAPEQPPAPAQPPR
jgi:hypothetical protein